MRPCFAFSNMAAADKSPAKLAVLDDIGLWGVQAKDFVESLAKIKDSGQTEVEVDIASNGGEVTAALTMYHYLRSSGLKVTTRVVAVAASAASLLFMAGDKRVMGKNTSLMIHGASTFAAGNTEAMKNAVAQLEIANKQAQDIYMSRSGAKEDTVKSWMSKDTWMLAEEAQGHGLATEVVEEAPITAKVDFDRLEMPDAIRVVMQASMKKDEPKDPPAAPPAAKTAEQIAAEAALAAELKLPLAEQITAMATRANMGSYAGVFAVACATRELAEQRIAVAREVRALCVALAKPAEADEFIRKGTSLADARIALAKAAAEKDEPVVTQRKGDPTQTSKTGTAVSHKSVWDAHRARSNPQQTATQKGA